MLNKEILSKAEISPSGSTDIKETILKAYVKGKGENLSTVLETETARVILQGGRMAEFVSPSDKVNISINGEDAMVYIHGNRNGAEGTFGLKVKSCNVKRVKSPSLRTK